LSTIPDRRTRAVATLLEWLMITFNKPYMTGRGTGLHRPLYSVKELTNLGNGNGQ
jgi:hypothetical protein